MSAILGVCPRLPKDTIIKFVDLLRRDTFEYSDYGFLAECISQIFPQGGKRLDESHWSNNMINDSPLQIYLKSTICAYKTDPLTCFYALILMDRFFSERKDYHSFGGSVHVVFVVARHLAMSMIYDYGVLGKILVRQLGIPARKFNGLVIEFAQTIDFKLFVSGDEICKFAKFFLFGNSLLKSVVCHKEEEQP